MKIENLIAECTAYDFKAEVEHRKSKSWLKSVSAFANGFGGSLFFGIDDDKQPVGIDDVRIETEYLSETIKNKIDPIPNFSLDLHDFDGKIVIQLKVFAGNSTPYYYFNEGSRVAYIRIGNESIVAPNDRLMSLILKGNNSTYDSVVTSNTIEDFTFINLASEYRNRVHANFDKKYLESFGLVTKKGFLTNAGLLLTDYCPVYQSRVFCTLWNGREKTSAINDAEYSGNLLQLLQNAQNFIKSSTKNGWIKLPDRRVNYPEYSERAILECLVNHLIHRDYTVIGGEVHVDIFDDRIVFTSPGGMYDGTLIQNCDINDVPSCRRNPVIADVFAHLNLMEKRGSGLRKICEETAKLPTYTDDRRPIFKSAGMSFSTVVYNMTFGTEFAEMSITEDEMSTTDNENVAQNSDVAQNVAQNVHDKQEMFITDGDVAQNVAQNVHDKQEMSITDGDVGENVGRKSTKSEYDNPLNDNVAQNVGKNVAQNDMKKWQMINKIIKLIHADHNITRQQMAEKIGVTKKTIERCLAEFRDVVKYEGSSKGGHWVVITDK